MCRRTYNVTIEDNDVLLMVYHFTSVTCTIRFQEHGFLISPEGSNCCVSRFFFSSNFKINAC